MKIAIAVFCATTLAAIAGMVTPAGKIVNPPVAKEQCCDWPPPPPGCPPTCGSIK